MTQDTPAQILRLEGADALAFAQAQFSCNVAALDIGRWQFGAWLDAQGRVLTVFHLARIDDDVFLLLLRGGDAESMAQSLRRFVFRSKVTLTPTQAALGTGDAIDIYTVHREGDAFVLGCGDHSMVIDASRADDAWRLPQIHAGWPWLPENTLGKILPQALSLERLHAVAFDKGCYPGQEIVARLHYRGGLKRHMHCVVLSQHVAGGTVLHHGDDGNVQLLDVASDSEHAYALAVIDDGLMTMSNDDDTQHIDEGIAWHVTTRWST